MTGLTIAYSIVNIALIESLDRLKTTSPLFWFSIGSSCILLTLGLAGTWYTSLQESSKKEKEKNQLIGILWTMVFCVGGVTIFLATNGLPSYQSYSLSAGIDSHSDFSAPAFAIVSVIGNANANISQHSFAPCNDTGFSNKCFHTSLASKVFEDCSDIFPSNFATYQSLQYGLLHYYLFNPGPVNAYLQYAPDKILLNSFVSCK